MTPEILRAALSMKVDDIDEEDNVTLSVTEILDAADKLPSLDRIEVLERLVMKLGVMCDA